MIKFLDKYFFEITFTEEVLFKNLKKMVEEKSRRIRKKLKVFECLPVFKVLLESKPSYRMQNGVHIKFV